MDCCVRISLTRNFCLPSRFYMEPVYNTSTHCRVHGLVQNVHTKIHSAYNLKPYGDSAGESHRNYH